jgi:3'-phosphoadenosine 5'-phosphosulfate sulfotransferase (PAPS reductase)/FAD synthetase
MPTIAPVDISRLRLKLPTPDQLNAARRKVATTTAVDELLNRNAVVAVGVSGGKDGAAAALAVDRHLNDIGHTGPRVLIHADLGRVEWKESLPECQRLAERMGWELLVVARKAGDMMARWEGRWKANVRRYTELECVKLILPWSTPSMRFCTSEMKTAIVCSALKERFPTQEILNVTGIRRQESANRAKAPVSSLMKRLVRKDVIGLAWNAVIEWTIEEVLQEIADAGLSLHEAYTTYAASRVSCCFCIMSTFEDLVAGASCSDNHSVYVSMCELEAESTFAFQGNRWLADVAPHLLSAELLAKIAIAKAKAKQRVELEKLLPKHLHYVKGWPTQLPTEAESELIAQVRRDVASVIGLEVKYTTGPEVLARYAELMRLKEQKAAAKRKGATVEADDDQDEEDVLTDEEGQFALF